MNTQLISRDRETRQEIEADYVRRILPPSTKDVSLLRIFERCATLLPVLLCLSTVGCLIGRYVLLIPLDRLGVVVSVPLAIGFLLVKGAMFAFPFNPQEVRNQKRPPLAFRFFGFAMIVSIFFGTSFLLSSPVYFLLGWRDLGWGALTLAAVGFAVAILAMIGALQQVLKGELFALLIFGLWRMAIVFLFPRLFVSRFHPGGGAPSGA